MSNKVDEGKGAEEKKEAATEPILSGVHLDEELVDGAAPALKDESSDSATPTPAQEPTPVPTPPPVTRHDSSATVTASSPKSHPKISPPLAPLTTPSAADDLEEPPTSSFSVSPSSRYFPLSTATMDTSVFDVVHIFSERGISAVPILDGDGVVLNMYETVDIVVSGCSS